MRPRNIVGLTFIGALLVSGCDDRRSGTDDEVLTFDASMVPFDSGSRDAGPSSLPDAGPMLGNEGEACGPSAGCRRELACVAGNCSAAGGLDQPCRADGACEPGLGCDSEICRPTIQTRFCHCIYESGTMTPIRLEMQIGSVLLGPSLANTCSPCVEVVVGSDIPYVIRREGDTTGYFERGTLNLTTDTPELGFAFSVGGIVPGPIECDRDPTGFCGT